MMTSLTDNTNRDNPPELLKVDTANKDVIILITELTSNSRILKNFIKFTNVSIYSNRLEYK